MGLALMHDPLMLSHGIHNISQCNPLLKIDPVMLPFFAPSCFTSFKSHCLAQLTGFAINQAQNVQMINAQLVGRTSAKNQFQNQWEKNILTDAIQRWNKNKLHEEKKKEM